MITSTPGISAQSEYTLNHKNNISTLLKQYVQWPKRNPDSTDTNNRNSHHNNLMFQMSSWDPNITSLILVKFSKLKQVKKE